MYSLEKIRGLQEKSDSALKVARDYVSKLNAEVDKLQHDTTRSVGWISEEIQKLRDKLAPLVGAQYEIVTKIKRELGSQKSFWESKPLVLSSLPFDGDPAKDAAIRKTVGRELGIMPIFQLKLAREAAKADGNLPLLYQMYLAASSRSADASKVGIPLDVSDLEIPGQLEGLASIAQSEINAVDCEFLVHEVVGSRLAPEKRLTISHRKTGPEAVLAQAARAAEARA